MPKTQTHEMDALKDEVESLEAIMMDDVKITRNSQSGIAESIQTTIFPEVGEGDEQQYVCVTLQVLPSASYPEVSPEFRLLRPRGLDDSRLEAIKTACMEKLQESVGYPVVFDLIEVVRKQLSDSNLPSGQCVICLYGFVEGDEFTRTQCFHYLHSYCLGRHLNAMRRSYQEEFDKLPGWQQMEAEPFVATCPVCRERIKDEAENLKCSMPPVELQNAPDFKLTRELRELQQRMSDLFLQQKSRGAIIDIEAESGTVISIETEEELRRRSQRKHNEGDNGAAAHKSEAESSSKGRASFSFDTKTAATDSKTAGNGRAAGSATFAPIVHPTQRLTHEPTNNNYQPHNRRHYRGGRRHQHHFHHHHRDRERHEQQHNHSTTSHSTEGGGAASATAGASGATSQSKQPKANSTSAAATR